MNLELTYTVHDQPIVSREGVLDAFDRLPADTFSEKVAYLARHMKTMPQTELPLKHHFSPGLYIREIFMPADTIVIGKIHKTEHANILVKGACLIVNQDGSREELRAPLTFISKAGVQKVLCILEDMIWMTTHVTEETDMEKLEAQLIQPMPNDLLEHAP